MDEIAYMDHAATTPVAPEVLEAMRPHWSDDFANPAGAYRPARRSQAALSAARAQVAAALGCAPTEVVFTSGGTESDNLAIVGVVRAARAARPDVRPHVVTTAIEHEAVLETVADLSARGECTATVLPVDEHGRVRPSDVTQALRPETALVSVMLASNVVGTIQPVAEIASALRGRHVPLHVDAVQAPLWLDLDVARLGADLLSLSAHKLCGPKGAGALYVREGTPIAPLLRGGGQEGGLRSGTSNVAGAVGLAAAMSLAVARRDDLVARVLPLRRQLVDALTSLPDVRLTGHPELRLPGHVSVVARGARSDEVLLALDRAGICAASSAACATGRHDAPAALAALGLDRAWTDGALRLTLGPLTVPEHVARALAVLVPALDRPGAPAGAPAGH